MTRRFVASRLSIEAAALSLVLVGALVARAEDSDAGSARTSGVPAAQGATPNAQPAATVTQGTSGAGDLVDAVPFAEDTTVAGNLDVKLDGVWLLVASPELAPGKFKNFPQLLKITQGKTGPEIHLLDVRFPESVEQSLRDTRQTMAAWVPSEDARKMLAANWSNLPLAKQKARDEFLFGKIHYLIASPAQYGTAFPQLSQAIENVLKSSKLGMQITEDYLPRPAKPNGSQVARRMTFYGVKTINPGELRGDMFTGFIAMGAGSPFPLEFHGNFVMYKLASL